MRFRSYSECWLNSLRAALLQKTPVSFGVIFILKRNYLHIYQAKIYKLTCNFSKAQALISYKQGIENIRSHK